MSLHDSANQVQSAGRGDDKVLVHMTPGEVSGLQSLAMAHGGSLTINPHTGLPEAGFLSSLLPMAIGFGLAPFTGGMSAALLTGAGYTAATGSLKKGIMAGLGAYGGASLMGGLTAAGADAAGAAASASAPPVLTSNAAANANYLGQAAEGAGSTYANTVDAARQAAMETPFKTAWQGLKSLGTEGGRAVFADAVPYSAMASGLTGTLGTSAAEKEEAAAEAAKKAAKQGRGMIRPYEFARTQNPEAYDIGAPMWAENPGSSREQTYFTDNFTALKPYKAPGAEYKAAAGGLTSLAIGGPVERMAAQNAVGENTGYPMANINTPMYANPMVQRPEATNVIAPSVDAGVGAYTGEARFASGGTADPKKSPGYTFDYDPNTMQFTQTSKPVEVTPTAAYGQYGPVGRTTSTWESQPTNIVTGGMTNPAMQAASSYTPYTSAPVQPYQSPEQQLGLGNFYNDMSAGLGALGYAAGGMSHLGDYSDGGRLLKGPGDGVSDSIPASIGDRQPARLADGEFVVPARIVSEIGNGSTEAGARKLYAMMDRVQRARKKTTGKNQVAANTKAEKLLPA